MRRIVSGAPYRHNEARTPAGAQAMVCTPQVVVCAFALQRLFVSERNSDSFLSHISCLVDETLISDYPH